MPDNMGRPAIVRPMRSDELGFASSLTLGEQWHSETIEEFEAFFAHDPAGCLVAELDARPVGIGVATAYGAVGFLGQIVVAPGLRGQGIGDALVAGLLRHLHAAGVSSVYLDATAAGAPLYQRHGFRTLQPSLRYAGSMAGGVDARVRPMRAADLDAVCALDRAWWGADRGFFLRRRHELHPGLAMVLEQDGAIEGYVLGRRRGDRVWIGPWCAGERVEGPESLLAALTPPSTRIQVHVGTLSGSERALQALERLGLAATTTAPWRMVRGPATGLGCHPAVLANGTSAKG